jgi:hypothetical protein
MIYEVERTCGLSEKISRDFPGGFRENCEKPLWITGVLVEILTTSRIQA